MMKTANSKLLRPAQLLTPQRVILAHPGVSKEDLIAALVRSVCRENPALDCNDIIAQVLKREEGIATTLDTGLSIPHARLEEIDSFQAALAIVSSAVEDPKSHQQIKAMFLFLSPANPAFFQGHLQILAGLAKTFTAEFIAELTALPSSQAVFERIAQSV